MIKIDCMGMVCPAPVIETKKVLRTPEAENGVLVKVDNVIATENLSKMAQQLNMPYEVKKISEEEFEVYINSKVENVEAHKNAENGVLSVDLKDYVVAIGSEEMGTGAVELGKKLMGSFIYSLTEQDDLPKIIVFYNSGVKITAGEGAMVDDLKKLKEKGVEILSCGLCLNYYGITESLKVGEVTNMYRILEILRSHHCVRP